jgi:phage tail-like protein
MATPTLLEYFLLDIPNVSQNGSLAGVFKSLSGLDVSFEVLEYREGGNNDFVHHLPGRVHYPNLVLSWGFTKSDLLQKWFFETQSRARLQQVTVSLAVREGASLSERRKWTFADAFPVRWSGPSFEAGSEGWTETLEIAHSGLKLV